MKVSDFPAVAPTGTERIPIVGEKTLVLSEIAPVVSNLIFINTGVMPTATPAGTTLAFDTSNGALWLWDKTNWHCAIAG